MIEDQLKGISQENPDVSGDFEATTDDIGTSLEDAAQEGGELYRNQALVSALKERHEEIVEAIRKIEKGEYGKCTNCSNEIHPDRLKAMPVAVLCKDCAEKASLV